MNQPTINELALFAGTGGGILGGKLLGWKTVCAVERDPYARDILVARQNDGSLEPFPIWDDVCTFDGNAWRGRVAVVSGGFPCQDISLAGNGDGLDGVRSGLWKEMVRIIGEVGPQFVFVENSPALTHRGLGTVLGDLAQMGFDAAWGVLHATDTGNIHKRARIWIVADSMRSGLATDMLGEGRKTRRWSERARKECKRWVRESSRLAGRRLAGQGEAARAARAWEDAPCEPLLLGVSDGASNRVDRIKCSGNGQVPSVVALAWTLLQPEAFSE